MKKDLINRILNVAELLGYFLVVCLYASGFFGWHNQKGWLITFLIFVAAARMCINYILQMRILNLAILAMMNK